MKSLIKYIATLSLVAMVGLTYGQSISERYDEAQAKLFELKQMDRSAMTKAEKKAWKRQKKYWKRVMALEEDRAEREYYAEGVRRFGVPYGYSPYYGGAYRYPYYGPGLYNPYRRPVVIVRPNAPVCENPSNNQRTQQVQRPKQIQTPRQAQRPKQVQRPSRNRR